jgi:hypothetical protein
LTFLTNSAPSVFNFELISSKNLPDLCFDVELLRSEFEGEVCCVETAGADIEAGIDDAVFLLLKTAENT